MLKQVVSNSSNLQIISSVICPYNYTSTAGALLVGARSHYKGEDTKLFVGLIDRSGAHEGRPCSGFILAPNLEKY